MFSNGISKEPCPFIDVKSAYLLNALRIELKVIPNINLKADKPSVRPLDS
jgi:hypothetical protein